MVEDNKEDIKAKEYEEAREDKEVIDLLKRFLTDDKEVEKELYNKYKRYINNNFLIMIKSSFSYDRVSKSSLAKDKDMAKKVSKKFWDYLVKSKRENFKGYDPNKEKLIDYIIKKSEEYYKNNKNKFDIDLLKRFLADDDEAGWELYNKYEKKIYYNLLEIIKSSLSDERISQSDLAKDMAKKVTLEFWEDLVRKKRRKLKNYNPDKGKLITYIMKMSENYLIDYMKKKYNIEVKRDKNKKSTDKIKVRSASLFSKIKNNNSSDDKTELIDMVILQSNPYPNTENEGIKKSILQKCTDKVNFINLNDDEFMNIMGSLIYRCLEEELYNKFKAIVDSGYKYVYYIEISLMSMIGFEKDEILSHVKDKEVEINKGNFFQRKHEGWKKIEEIIKDFKENASDCCSEVFNYEKIELTKLFTIKIAEWLEEFQNDFKKIKIRKKLDLWLSRY
ncbi:MAG: hypothetical protein ACOCRX_03665 [Candidatus Woesearchaeota archaeon]